MTVKLFLAVPMTARKSVNWIFDEQDIPLFSSNNLAGCIEYLAENNIRVFHLVARHWWTLCTTSALIAHRDAAIGDPRQSVAPPPPPKDIPPWQK